MIAVRAAAMLAAAVLAAAGCAGSPGQPGTSPAGQRAAKVPALRVLTSHAHNGNGDIFLTPHGGGYPSGPEIFGPDGRVIWFHPLPAGAAATDFRTQTYRGKPVLTWCQLGAKGSTLTWTDYIYDDRYRRIARSAPAMATRPTTTSS